jgi:DNA-binding LacI/PurR family transcriptional regulator
MCFIEELIVTNRITIKDVAEEAGVSHPVVSTVLRGKKSSIKCSPETRRRILATAKNLNYTPNLLARSFRNQQSYLIGVLFCGVNFSILTEFISGFQEKLSQQGYSPVLFIHNNPEEELDSLKLCLERKVDGLIVNFDVHGEGVSNSTEFSRLSENIPVVEIFGHEVDDVSSLTLDYYSGAMKATRYLIKEGHEKIALYIHDRSHMHESVRGLYMNAWQYKQGYLQAIKEAGLQEFVFTHSLSDNLSTSGASFDGAFKSAGEILDHPAKPTAILCLNHEEVDAMMMCMASRKNRLNRDFHIISQGSSMYSRVGRCKVTTLAPPITAIGKKASDVILDLIDGGSSEDCSYGFQLISQDNSNPSEK